PKMTRVTLSLAAMLAGMAVILLSMIAPIVSGMFDENTLIFIIFGSVGGMVLIVIAIFLEDPTDVSLRLILCNVLTPLFATLVSFLSVKTNIIALFALIIILLITASSFGVANAAFSRWLLPIAKWRDHAKALDAATAYPNANSAITKLLVLRGIDDE